MIFSDKIKAYLNGLEAAQYDEIIQLFSKNAIIFSPLYGKIQAKDFYRDLFKDTNKSKITLLNIFLGNGNTAAGHFKYNWELADKTQTSFECVDVFKFNEKGKITELRIIYDTAKVRPEFTKMKHQN